MRNIAYRRPSSRSGSTHHDRDINGANCKTSRLADWRWPFFSLRTESGATHVTESVTGSITMLLHRDRRNRLCNSACNTPRFSAVHSSGDCRSRTESGATRVTGSVTGSVTMLLHRGRRNRLCNSAVTPLVSARFTAVATAGRGPKAVQHV
jgi:hypothetical protein